MRGMLKMTFEKLERMDEILLQRASVENIIGVWIEDSHYMHNGGQYLLKINGQNVILKSKMYEDILKVFEKEEEKLNEEFQGILTKMKQQMKVPY